MEKENKKKTKIGMLVSIGVVAVAIIATSTIMIKENNIKKAYEAKKIYIEKISTYKDRINLEIPNIKVNSEEEYIQITTKINDYQALLDEASTFLNESIAPDGCEGLQTATRKLIVQGESLKNTIKDFQQNNHEIDLLLKNGKFDTLESQSNVIEKLAKLEEQSSGIKNELEDLSKSTQRVNEEYNKIKESLEESAE